jgi:hypothetical protein
MMITKLPAVQHSCKYARRIVCYSPKTKREDKRYANRQYRRVLNLITRGFIRDPDSFYDEVFDTPSLSAWDIY